MKKIFHCFPFVLVPYFLSPLECPILDGDYTGVIEVNYGLH